MRHRVDAIGQSRESMYDQVRILRLIANCKLSLETRPVNQTMTAGEISEQPGEADKVTEYAQHASGANAVTLHSQCAHLLCVRSINTVPSSQLSESTSLLGSNEDKAESKSQTKKTVVRWIIGVAIFSLIGIILALVLTNVLGNRDQNLKDSCVVNYDEFINYFPENVVVLQSIGFSVTYSKAYKVRDSFSFP